MVTGGYSGLGLETTRALVKAGARVLVPARRPELAHERLGHLSNVTEPFPTCLCWSGV
ncbi:SDR family NAD(P)-dependent oxidoreductase [Pseudonocardia sp. ICBG601]|uniref:SDR family NAD(P)-dependent oxidoreductase n=1 Tax=Pseudonocardia sp. ICBG601 TaxID=2846759 RepID=UPI0035ABD29C